MQVYQLVYCLVVYDSQFRKSDFCIIIDVGNASNIYYWCGGAIQRQTRCVDPEQGKTHNGVTIRASEQETFLIEPYLCTKKMLFRNKD